MEGRDIAFIGLIVIAALVSGLIFHIVEKKREQPAAKPVQEPQEEPVVRSGDILIARDNQRYYLVSERLYREVNEVLQKGQEGQLL